MKKETLQGIEDFYENKGYKGKKLRVALEIDKGYQKLLEERKRKLLADFRVTEKEKSKYVLSLDSDFKILGLCKKLEKLKLSKTDKELVRLIRSQLELEWRTPLLKELNRIARKYG